MDNLDMKTLQKLEEKVKEKINSVPLVCSKHPDHVKYLVKMRNKYNAEYLEKKILQLKVVVDIINPVIEKEIQLHKYRHYRDMFQRTLPFTIGELTLERFLDRYITKLVHQNLTFRLLYTATKETCYKINHQGSKKAIHILVAANKVRLSNEDYYKPDPYICYDYSVSDQ